MTGISTSIFEYLEASDKKVFLTKMIKKITKIKNGSKVARKKSARKKVTRIMTKIDIEIQKKILRTFCQTKKIDMFCKKLRKSSLKI